MHSRSLLVLFPALALWLASSTAPRVAQTPNPAPIAPPKSASAPAHEEAARYPGFEPFRASRFMKGMFANLDKIDLAELALQADQQSDINAQARAAGEAFGEKKTDAKALAPSAELEKKSSAQTRKLCTVLPFALAQLKPLWEAKVWAAEQLALAQRIATILSADPDAPKLAFDATKPEANHKELEKLVRWYRSLVAKPDCYAAMFFTMDDGPYVGLPYENSKALAATQVKALDARTELRLVNVEREHEPWVLQCVRDGVPLWTRVVSAAPKDEVGQVEFRASKPQALGEYGWKVVLTAHWTYGTEQMVTYLDRDAQLLFYWLSW